MMKNSHKVIILSVIVLSAVLVAVAFSFNGGAEESDVQDNVDDEVLEEEPYNSTHGYVVKIETGGYQSEKGGYNPRTYDPETGTYYESWDFSYFIDLLDGTSTVKILRHRVSEEFEVGDFVEIGTSDYEIYLVEPEQ
jgi:hypothetical protein